MSDTAADLIVAHKHVEIALADLETGDHVSALLHLSTAIDQLTRISHALLSPLLTRLLQQRIDDGS